MTLKIENQIDLGEWMSNSIMRLHQFIDSKQLAELISINLHSIFERSKHDKQIRPFMVKNKRKMINFLSANCHFTRTYSILFIIIEFIE